MIDTREQILFFAKHRTPNSFPTAFDSLIIGKDVKPLNDVVSISIHVTLDAFIIAEVGRIKLKEGTNQQEIEDLGDGRVRGKTYTETYIINNLNFEAFKVVEDSDAKSEG